MAEHISEEMKRLVVRYVITEMNRAALTGLIVGIVFGVMFGLIAGRWLL